MGLKELPIRREVFEEIDPAPKLGKILEVLDGKDIADVNARIMANAKEFFKRTFITPNMLNLLEKIVDSFEGKGKRIFALYSFYGGGKTHTLLAIIHAFRNPEILTDPEVTGNLEAEIRAKLEQIAERIKRIKVEVIPFAGDHSKYSGSPINPTNAGNYSYRTVWGYIAHRLNRYYEIKEYDEKLIAPQQDVIAKLLDGEKALFVFDELSDYLINLIGHETYAKTVVNFVEHFIQAVRDSKSVVVVSLPVDPSGNVDWRYKDVEIIQSLWNTLKGLAEPIEPIATTFDLLNVLKKRLFESIPKPDRVVQRFKEVSINYLQYFSSDYIDRIKECYPFSPEYIELLQTLIVRTKMQRTRDALAISMKVLREAVKDDPELIMPWHINLLWFEKAFLEGLSDYRLIYIKQVENAPQLSYGELTKYILRAIFLATYHYDTPIPRNEFPDVRAIVRMVYEPATFSRNNWEVTDIENALSEILSTPEITHLNEKDGKYWFWRFPSIKEYIHKKAQNIYEDDDPRIYDVIEDYLKRSVEGTLRVVVDGRKRRRTRTTTTKHFDEYYIIKDYDQYPEDNTKLKLVILLRPDLIQEVENVYNYVEKDKPRSYKNTLIVVAPESEKNFNELKKVASALLAIQEVREEIEAYYGEYGEEVVKVQKSMVEREQKEQEVKMAGFIPVVYSMIYYYPVSDSNITTEKVVQPGYNVAENIYNTLVSVEKIVEKMAFDYLRILLKNEVGIDIERDEQMRTVEQIIMWFKQNPRFPIARDEVIKKAIIEGVKEFKIGILRGTDEIYFKPVHQTIPPMKDVEGKAPSDLKPSDVILPRDRAIEEQFRILKSQEGSKKYLTHVERVYFVVYPELGGEGYTLDQLKEMPGWKEIFLSGVIVRKVIKVTKDLIVEVIPSKTITVKEDQEVKVTIKAEPINLEIDGITIEVKQLNLKDEMTVKDNAYFYELTLPPVEKSYDVILLTYGKDEVEKTITVRVKIKPKEEVIETDEIKDEHIGMYLLRIKDVEDVDVLRVIKDSILPLNVKGKIFGKIMSTYSGGDLILEVRNLELETGIHATLELSEYGEERKITQPFTINFEDLEVTELLVRKLEPLNKRVKFVLRGETE